MKLHCLAARKCTDTEDTGPAQGGGWISIWDLPTRIFHWSVVALVMTSWISADRGIMQIHLFSGSMLLALVLFRIVWGFIGSSTALFREFLTRPRRVWSYVLGDNVRQGEFYAGHNPAGGWMIVVLIVALCVQAITGLFSNDDVNFNGPLSSWISKDFSDSLTRIHSAMFNVLLLLIWVHILAVFYYLFVQGENLIRPMYTGKKRSSSVPPGARLNFVSPYKAMFALLVATAIVILIVTSRS